MNAHLWHPILHEPGILGISYSRLEPERLHVKVTYDPAIVTEEVRSEIAIWLGDNGLVEPQDVVEFASHGEPPTRV